MSPEGVDPTVIMSRICPLKDHHCLEIWKEDGKFGTSDEHITVMESMREVKCDGAIIVTTPQQVALEDVRKEITFCKKTNINIIGIVENMSGFVCPNCDDCTNIFSSEGGVSLAATANVPHLGTLPIDPKIGELAGSCQSVLTALPNSRTADAFRKIVDAISNKEKGEP